jgi:dTDP-4-dehydrorhamnose 3,5-epimerase
MIESVIVRRLSAHADARGSFGEIYSDAWGLPISPRQWSWVRSTPGSLRGMHVHVRHHEYVCVIAGRALIGLHDLRPYSSTSGQSQLIELTADDPACIAFPSGIVHGWYFPEGGAHLQAVSEPYLEYGGDDNLGCRYDDPDLGIAWPGVPTHLSARALAFPSLKDLRARIQPRLLRVHESMA